MIKGDYTAETDVYGYCRAGEAHTQQVLYCPLGYCCDCAECEEFEPDPEAGGEYDYCTEAENYIENMERCPLECVFKRDCLECECYTIKEEEE